MTGSQPEFRAALLDAQRPVPAGLLDGAGQQAGARFDVYRNNVAVSLTEALHNAFPVLTRLIGAETMDQLAALFLRAHPRLSSCLTWGVIAFEGAFPLALLAGPACWGFLAAGLLFHLANAALVGFNRFPWAWAATYPAILYAARPADVPAQLLSGM